MARGGLVAPKARKSPPRREKSSLYAKRNDDDDDVVSGGVSTKSLQIQSSNNKTSSGPSELKRSSSGLTTSKEPDYPSGLNKDLCSLAQQFFTHEGANKKPTKKPVMSVKPQPQQPQPKPTQFAEPTKPERRPMAHSNGGGSIPERVSFQPFDEKLEPEIEEEDISLRFGLQREMPRQSRAPPKEVDSISSGTTFKFSNTVYVFNVFQVQVAFVI